eukprot:scaffold1056_cov159-Pinguiococcus_pyrenoidosus.AAC.1
MLAKPSTFQRRLQYYEAQLDVRKCPRQKLTWLANLELHNLPIIIESRSQGGAAEKGQTELLGKPSRRIKCRRRVGWVEQRQRWRLHRCVLGRIK